MKYLPEQCPFCGTYVSENMARHIEVCPGLVIKRSPQIAIPGRETYVEGQLPPHLKQVILQKSFLSDVEVE